MSVWDTMRLKSCCPFCGHVQRVNTFKTVKCMKDSCSRSYIVLPVRKKSRIVSTEDEELFRKVKAFSFSKGVRE